MNSDDTVAASDDNVAVSNDTVAVSDETQLWGFWVEDQHWSTVVSADRHTLLSIDRHLTVLLGGKYTRKILLNFCLWFISLTISNCITLGIVVFKSGEVSLDIFFFSVNSIVLLLSSQERDEELFQFYYYSNHSLEPSNIYWLSDVLDGNTTMDHLPLTSTLAENVWMYQRWLPTLINNNSLFWGLVYIGSDSSTSMEGKSLYLSGSSLTSIWHLRKKRLRWCPAI